jgi:hypothetical protein
MSVEILPTKIPRNARGRLQLGEATLFLRRYLSEIVEVRINAICRTVTCSGNVRFDHHLSVIVLG